MSPASVGGGFRLIFFSGGYNLPLKTLNDGAKAPY